MSRFSDILAVPVFLGLINVSSASGGSLYNPADARAPRSAEKKRPRPATSFSAMDANPAALASLESPEAAITLTGALLHGDFEQKEPVVVPAHDERLHRQRSRGDSVA